MQGVAQGMGGGFLARRTPGMRLGLYAWVSTQEQQTLALQREAMVAYAAHRGGVIVLTIEEINSGAQERRQREILMQAARRRAIDAIVVWRLVQRAINTQRV